MVFGLFPKDFNEIEFWAVGWQVAEECIEFLPPTQGEAVVQPVMNSGIVENDEGWNRFSDLRNQIRHEIDKGFAVDGSCCLRVIQALPNKVQRAHDRDTLVMGRCDRMCFPNRRPSTLYGRRGRETRFVIVKQLATAFPRRRFQTSKLVGTGGKLLWVTLFFRLIRVRLKLNPCAFRSLPSRSSESGKDSP